MSKLKLPKEPSVDGYIISIAIFGGIFIALAIYAWFWNRRNGGGTEETEGVPARPAGVAAAAVAEEMGDDVPEGLEDEDTGKIGAKKAAKLQAKADRQAANKAAAQEREENKKLDAERARKRAAKEKDEAAEEEAQMLIERAKKEEQERKEYEEYLQLKQSFAVEEEGVEALTDEQAMSLLQRFLDYIKTNKVLMLDDIAGHFQMKTQDVIERIHTLMEDGSLTGVIDDRGKFIYVTPDELNAVADFIKTRGRVSIQQLVQSSNKLVKVQGGG